MINNFDELNCLKFFCCSRHHCLYLLAANAIAQAAYCHRVECGDPISSGTIFDPLVHPNPQMGGAQIASH